MTFLRHTSWRQLFACSLLAMQVYPRCLAYHTSRAKNVIMQLALKQKSFRFVSLKSSSLGVITDDVIVYYSILRSHHWLNDKTQLYWLVKSISSPSGVKVKEILANKDFKISVCQIYSPEWGVGLRKNNSMLQKTAEQEINLLYCYLWDLNKYRNFQLHSHTLGVSLSSNICKLFEFLKQASH